MSAPQERDYRSRAEVVKAILSFTDADKTRLNKYARIQAAKTSYDAEDLVQEALTRCLEGRRPWPRDVAVLNFLAGVIKTIASEWKKGPSPDPDREPGDGEAVVIARLDAEKLIKSFDDDLIAQSIVISMMLGARGEDLRRSSGLNETEYESKRKKIRRRLENMSRM
jgi:hypothetical protein